MSAEEEDLNDDVEANAGRLVSNLSQPTATVTLL